MPEEACRWKGNDMTDLSTLAASLSEAQKRFIRAASKRPKKWHTIRRHAKIAPTKRVFNLITPMGVVQVIGGGLEYHTVLTPLGLALRDHLERNG